MSSPLEPSGASALIRTMSSASMPSVAKFRRWGDDRGWYVVVDPAGRHSAIGRPDRSVDFEPAIRTMIFLVCIVGIRALGRAGQVEHAGGDAVLPARWVGRRPDRRAW